MWVIDTDFRTYHVGRVVGASKARLDNCDVDTGAHEPCEAGCSEHFEFRGRPYGIILAQPFYLRRHLSNQLGRTAASRSRFRAP